MAKCSRCQKRTNKPTVIQMRGFDFEFCRLCVPEVQKAIKHSKVHGPVQDATPKKKAPIAPTIEMFDRREYLKHKDVEHS